MPENVLSKYSLDEMTIGDRFKRLSELFESGEIVSINELLGDLEQPEEKELIKRASLLRSFDKTLYTDVLQQSQPDDFVKISFDKFTRNLNVEPIPRTEKVFRVKDGVLQNYLQELRAAPMPPAEIIGAPFLQKLISYYQGNEQEYNLDLLGILILTESAEAEKKFLQLFEAADKNFDLAQCHDILKILEDRQMFLSPNLAQLSQQKRQYLKARNLFAADYFKTNFHYPRQTIVQEFSDLLKESATNLPRWIFHLHATGGMGKTMFIQWLIARYCIPEPRKIPVARLDFDYLHLPTAESYPWLLILAIVEQLNQQIENSPFNEHLSSYWHFIPLLYPPSETPGDSFRADLEEQVRNISEPKIKTILEKTFDALTDSGFQNPFVIVLDTLEEMILHHGEKLIAVLNQLETIHKIYPPMRLLLSGRYPLGARLKKFKNQFDKHTITLELKPFAEEESRAYLVEKRNLENEAIIEAIIEKCEDEKRQGSNPFKVSLFADLYQQKEVKTPEEILSYPRTDFAYLIERIIDRIKEPSVQWLLRYAVIPRQFTFDIFEKVLAYHLERELIEKQNKDQPNENLPEKYANRKIWKDEKAKKLVLQSIWKDLKNYASASSWIIFDAGGSASPRLHPDVVIPMRILLEKHKKIFNLLNSDAARYFKRKAKSAEDEKLWAQSICEVIYHVFQLEGATAAGFWRRQLSSVKSKRNPHIRRKIAKEITGNDYVDEDGNPILKKDGQYLVAPPDLLEAHYRAVEASVALIVKLNPTDQASEWANIRKHLTRAQQLRRKKIHTSEDYQLPFVEFIIRRLADQMRHTKVNLKVAIPLLENATRTTTDGQMLLSLEIQLADALVRQSDKQALKHYEKALRIRKTIKYRQIDECEIFLRIGRWHHDQKDFLKAESFYRKALNLTNREKNLAVRQNALRYLADINLELGQYDAAVNRLEEVKQITKNTGEENFLLDALFLAQVQARTLFEPLQALKEITPYLDISGTLRERAALNELHGDILGILMRFDDALTRLEKATQLWTKAANTIGADRVRMLRIGLQVFEIGNYNEASALFNSWEKEAVKTDLEIVCRVRLFRILFEFRNGNQKTARELWRKMAKDSKISQSPRLLVRVLATGMILGFGDASIVRSFITELRKVKPVSARLPLLEVFCYADSFLTLSAGARRAIKKLIAVESKGRDIVPHAILRAYVLNCCGKTELAREILDKAGQEARQQKNSFAYRNVLLAKDRLGGAFVAGDNLFDSSFLQDFADYPNLCAAGYLEQARRFFTNNEIQKCRGNLAYAQEILKKPGSLTTQLDAKANELKAHMEQATGNFRTARFSFNSALSVYEKLGNKPAVARMQQFLPEVRRQVSEDKNVSTLRLNSTPKTLQVEFYFNDVPEHQESFTLKNQNASASTQDRLLQAMTSSIGDISPLYLFSKLLTGNLNKIENEIGKILFSEKFIKTFKDQSQKSYLRLDSLSSSLAKMPWELSRLQNRAVNSLCRYFYRSASDTVSDSEKVKWQQIALRHLIDPKTYIDGVYGRKTEASLDKLKKKFNLPNNLSQSQLYIHLAKLLGKDRGKRNTKVLLIFPSREQQILSARGLDVFTPMDSWYQTPNIGVDMISEAGIGYLKRTMQRVQPDIVHILSSYRVVPETEQIFLDFGFDESNRPISQSSFQTDESSLIYGSAAFLNDAFALLPDAKMRPLLILDAIRPPGITETIHQLLYRNTFAAQVFQLGNTSGIIAMGLAANRRSQKMIQEKLVERLCSVKSFGDVVNSLRRLSDSENLEDRIATAGIALFTNEPLLTVLSSETR